MSRLGQAILILGCILTFGGIVYLTVKTEDTIHYTQTEYEVGRILDTREATFVDIRTKRNIDGCNIVYSDAEGKIREEDTEYLSGEVCKDFKNTKDVRIRVDKEHLYSKRKEEVIDVRVKKSLIIPSDINFNYTDLN